MKYQRKHITVVISTLLAATLSLPLYAGDREGDQHAYDVNESQHAEKSEMRTAGEMLDDTTIAARTEAALAADDVTEAWDIDIEVDERNVQLNGFVNSEEARDRAGEIAMNVNGVESVQNNLRVNEGDRTAGEYLDDKVLAGKVKAALVDTSEVNAMYIDVEVDRGVISLGGHVKSQSAHDAALAAARQVEGVVEVIDNIAVRS